MRIHRFCSEEEYKKFISGEKLTNYKDHGAERGYEASTAVGFCFFIEDPEEAKHWLAGIVDFDYCLTFQVPHTAVKLCHGRYANWIKLGVSDGSIKRTEFCCTEYDNKTFKLLNASDKFRVYAPNARDVKAFVDEIINQGRAKLKLGL